MPCTVSLDKARRWLGRFAFALVLSLILGALLQPASAVAQDATPEAAPEVAPEAASEAARDSTTDNAGQDAGQTGTESDPSPTDAAAGGGLQPGLPAIGDVDPTKSRPATPAGAGTDRAPDYNEVTAEPAEAAMAEVERLI
jgi:hypothetical protein